MKIVEKRLVPELRFPEFSGEWEEKRLGELLEFKNGINASKEQYGKGIKFINVLDILENNFITYKNILGKVNVDDKTIKKYEVNYGDVLFQRSSETREEVGTANVYLDDKPATFGGFVIRGKKISEYNPIFLNFALEGDYTRREIMSKSGGSTRYNVSQQILSEASVILSNLKEQEKLANFFVLIDNKIEKQEKKVVNLEEYKQGMMQKIFNQEIRFKDEDGEDYPEWEEKKLGEQCSFFSGGTPSSKNSNYYDGNIPFIKSGEINFNETESFLTKEGFKNSSAKLVDIGDVLYALYGATSGEVGISKIKGAINQAVLCIRTIEIDNDYLVQLLRNKKNYIIMTYIQGGQGNLSANIIKSLSFKFPTMREQEKISSMLLIIDLKIDKEKEKLDSLKEFKEGLMQKMFI